MTCTWEPDTACLGDSWDSLSEPVKERALMLATSSLQTLTLGRVGACPITIRPVPAKSGCGHGFHPRPLSNGVWVNDCICQSRLRYPSEIDIPGPVGYIDEFKIDGHVVDIEDGNWRLDDGHLLVWQGDGASPIPVRNDLTKPDTEVGTYSITYSRSYPVGPDARIAVAYLAAEFAAACKPKAKCALPRGVTSVVRNGVSFTIEAGLFPNGLTGLAMVDPFILKWAPAGAPQRSAQVFDPSKARARVSSMIPRRSTETQVTSTVDLLIRKGATFSHGWGVTYNGAPIDATWTATGQVRASVGSPTVLLDLDPTVNPDGSVVIALTPAQSSALGWNTGVYGIEVSKGPVTLRVAQGSVTATDEVVV